MEQTECELPSTLPSKLSNEGPMTPPNLSKEVFSSSDTEKSEPVLVMRSESASFEQDILQRLTLNAQAVEKASPLLGSPFSFPESSTHVADEAFDQHSPVLPSTPTWNTSRSLSPDPSPGDTDSEAEYSTPDNYMDVEFNVDVEWLGTSQYYTPHGVELQVNGQLEFAVQYRKFVIEELSRMPYDPTLYLSLCLTDHKLGYTDVSASNAYRALLLIEAGLGLASSLSLDGLGDKVRASVGSRLCTNSKYIIEDELEDLRKQAYRELLAGLAGCGAFWDGLQEAKKALKLYSNDIELLQTRRDLKIGFEDKHNGLKELGASTKEILENMRIGKIFQKKYPWLDEVLYFRTPALVREVNKTLSGICEVKPVVFGPTPTTPKKFAEDEDVGPLGIFAKRDILAGEVILVDKSIAGISNISPSLHEFCDACHACLLPPYCQPHTIIHPSCCGRVAFCSRECYQEASSGYHSVLCGKDIDWLYKHNSLNKFVPDSEIGPGMHAFRPVLFTRLAAIALGASPSSPQHPLQHPLIARLTANYTPPDRVPDITYGWGYYENVVAPTQILLQLGVDIFADRRWDPEVIQTICWRMENNANSGNPSLFPPEWLPIPSPTGPAAPGLLSTKITGKFNQVNINPNYLFLNHSCLCNVNWHTGVAYEKVGLEWIRGVDDELVRPGCSAVWCNAARDIQKGEQLTISYVGNPLGKDDPDDGSDDSNESEESEHLDSNVGPSTLAMAGRKKKREWLKKWFENGCGCEVCEGENAREKEKLARNGKVEGKEVLELI